jgi:plasmid stability protein
MPPPTVRLSVNIPPDTDKQLRVHVAKHGETVTAFLVRAIQGQIARENREDDQ